MMMPRDCIRAGRGVPGTGSSRQSFSHPHFPLARASQGPLHVISRDESELLELLDRPGPDIQSPAHDVRYETK